MKAVEAVGRNIEQAIENALFELKAAREDVDIKIISEGGLFRKAKVVVSISEDAIEKYEKKEENRAKFLEEEDGLVISKTELKKEKEAEKEAKKEEKEKIKEEKKAEKEAEKVREEEGKEEKKTKRKNKIVEPIEFLTGLFKTAGKEVEIEAIDNDDCVIYSIKGEDLGSYIGYRGETLFSISYLTSILAGKTSKRVLVDIENYREKRIESLRSLASRMASKVAKTGRYVKLEPMDPAERRIIHLALQDNDKVTTLSKGTEPHRYVMIFPREYKDQ